MSKVLSSEFRFPVDGDLLIHGVVAHSSDSAASEDKSKAVIVRCDGHLFVNIEDKALLVRIDVATNAVSATWPLAPCVEPTGLALDVARRRAPTASKSSAASRPRRAPRRWHSISLRTAFMCRP
jgi:hypothetical protein